MADNLDDEFLYSEEIDDLERVPIPKLNRKPQGVPISELTEFQPPTSRSGQMWTRDQDEELVELYLARVTPTEIAEKMGRSRDSIFKRIKTISFPFPEDEPEISPKKKRTGKWFDSEDNFICDSYRSGLSLADVALTTGRSVEQICMRLAKLGVAVPSSLDDIVYFTPFVNDGQMPSKQGQKWTEEDKVFLEQAFKEGKDLKEQSLLVERTLVSVMYQLYRLGLVDDEDLSDMVTSAQTARRQRN